MEPDRRRSILKIFIILMFQQIYCKLRQKTIQNDLFYILLWTDKNYVPFSYWLPEKKLFTTIGCEYQNCYIVDDIQFIGDVTNYDAILFNSIDLTIDTKLPKARSDNQMYIFVSTESSINYPTHEKFNWFFNFTWTFKMDSDIFNPYFIIRNKRGDVIAPKHNVKWMNVEDMEPTSISLTSKLDKKKIAATWFVTNCRPNERIHYLRSLREALGKYDLSVDVYGFCESNKKCIKDNMDACLALIESDYYFYLSFENSFAEDYVTEKLMNALDYYAVPVVMGGADYSRFMPDGIYLNANDLTGAQLATKIDEAIKNKEIYYEYFKWHGHYSYHIVTDSADTDPLCTFCAFLNNETNRNRRQVYARFVKWWNGFDSEFNATGDIIVYFNHSRTQFESKFEDATTTAQSLIDFSVTPSIVESIAYFVGSIFSFYSN